MQQVFASYRAVEASVTNIQLASQRQNLSVEARADSASQGFNPQQKQIIDDVGISDSALEKLQDAQELANQLQNYLDYLKGRGQGGNILLKPADGNADITIQGRSTNLAASITVATYNEERLDIAATFDDAGNLTELIVNKTSISAEYVKADFILEDTQFYAELKA